MICGFLCITIYRHSNTNLESQSIIAARRRFAIMWRYHNVHRDRNENNEHALRSAFRDIKLPVACIMRFDYARNYARNKATTLLYDNYAVFRDVRLAKRCYASG